MFAYEATLRVENPLSFRTNEYGNIVRTGTLLHNFALRFALNGIQGNPDKDHMENLSGAPIYATPAVPLSVNYEFQTFHPFPEAPQLLKNPQELTPGARRTYQGNYTILHYKEFVKPGSTFRFGVASMRELPKEMIITLGNKQTLQRVILENAHSVSPVRDFSGRISHPINPLDFPDDIRLTDVIHYTIPPSPLFEGTASVPFRARVVSGAHNEYLVPPSW
jgi:CRISPR type I-D-associated protein Csc1